MLRDLEKGWHSYFSNERTADGMRLVVKESWERCQSHGLTPTYLAPQRYDPELLKRAQEASSLMMRVAEPILQVVHETVQDQPHLLGLCDGDGRVLRLWGDPHIIQAGKETNLFEGASWHERDSGCNGAGTALACGHPVILIGPEHFMQDYATWTCLGVPVRGANQEIIGAVDFSVPNESISVHTWGWMLSVGQMIEAQLRKNQLPVASPQYVTHQFHHPLNAIRGVVDLLCEQGGLLPSHLRLIADALGQAESLTERLLHDSPAGETSQERDLRTQAALFLAALDHFTDGFLAIDSDGLLLTSNARAREWFHPVQLESGLPVTALGLPEALTTALVAVAEEPASEPVQLSFKAGSRSVAAFVLPVAGQGSVAILQDISRSVRYKQAQENLVANLSREVRAPLTTLSALIEAFRDGVIPNVARTRYLNGISRNLSQLRALVSDILDLARLETETRPPELVDLDLSQALADLNRHWEIRFAGKQVDYQTEVTATRVRANLELLHRSVQRLLEHALHSTPEGALVRLVAAMEADGVRLQILHEGSELIEPPGSTVGLAIVKRLVEIMGGRLEIDSAPGQASSLTIILPPSPATEGSHT